MADGIFDVLSPWAETDPIPLQGITPRLDEVRGKRIGLYANYKRAAVPVQDAVHAELSRRYGNAITIERFHHSGSNDVASGDASDKFTQWVQEVDAVIVAVGD